MARPLSRRGWRAARRRGRPGRRRSHRTAAAASAAAAVAAAAAEEDVVAHAMWEGGAAPPLHNDSLRSRSHRSTVSGRRRSEVQGESSAVHDASRAARCGRRRQLDQLDQWRSRPLTTLCEGPAGHAGAGGMREAQDGTGGEQVFEEAARGTSVPWISPVDRRTAGMSVARPHHRRPPRLCSGLICRALETHQRPAPPRRRLRQPRAVCVTKQNVHARALRALGKAVSTRQRSRHPPSCGKQPCTRFRTRLRGRGVLERRAREPCSSPRLCRGHPRGVQRPFLRECVQTIYEVSREGIFGQVPSQRPERPPMAATAFAPPADFHTAQPDCTVPGARS